MTQAEIEKAMRRALEHHQAGRLAEAGEIYGRVVAAQPRRRSAPSAAPPPACDPAASHQWA